MRILHTMLRVGNLDRSLAFYTEVLGMHLLRRQDYPEGRFTLASALRSAWKRATVSASVPATMASRSSRISTW